MQYKFWPTSKNGFEVIMCLCNARQHFHCMFCICARIFPQTETARARFNPTKTVVTSCPILMWDKVYTFFLMYNINIDYLQNLVSIHK